MKKQYGGANMGQPDPIQNRTLCNRCWDGEHLKCTGWVDKRTPCKCLHKEAVQPARRVSKKQQAKATMEILESGCGEITIR